MPFFPTPQPKCRDFESRVQRAGYPWTSTARLRPYGTGTLRRKDVLNKHRHQSGNTHLIVEGQLTLHFPNGEIEDAVLDASSQDIGQKEKTVPPYVYYVGIAGPKGAVFVEGHSILSPTTAERYRERGHLIWKDDGSGETQRTVVF